MNALSLISNKKLFFKINLTKLILIVFTVILSACSENEQVELEQWMQEQKKMTPTTVAPIEKPKQFSPVSYQSFMNDDPFDELKLKRILDRLRNSNTSLIKPDLLRKRTLLESYPIDSIKMVGFITQKNKPVAILSVSGVLFNVSVGDYLGQDFGKITNITEQSISFKELVQDGSGVWVKRDSQLPLTIADKESKDKVVESKK